MTIKNLIAAGAIALSPTVAVSQQWQAQPSTPILQMACVAMLSEIEGDFPDLYEEINFYVDQYGAANAVEWMRETLLLGIELERRQSPPGSELERRVGDAMAEWLATDGLKTIMAYRSYDEYVRNLSSVRTRLMDGCVRALGGAFANPT